MPKFTAMLNDEMEEKGISIKQLSKLCGITYEHARRFTNGSTIPTDKHIEHICAELGMNVDNAKSLAQADRIIARFGSVPEALKRPESCINLLEGVWSKLTVDQQDSIIEQAHILANANQARSAHA